MFFQLFLKFLVIKTLEQEPDPYPLEMLDPDPNSLNPDPQHWSLGYQGTDPDLIRS
jgi:hypothetical protein